MVETVKYGHWVWFSGLGKTDVSTRNRCHFFGTALSFTSLSSGDRRLSGVHTIVLDPAFPVTEYLP